MEYLAYKPLQKDKEIRFLELSTPSDVDEEITCNLHHVSLEDFPDYEALSYVWGQRTSDEPLFIVNGRKHHVTLNLHSALLQIRLR